jgi:hypothetical protein
MPTLPVLAAAIYPALHDDWSFGLGEIRLSMSHHIVELEI